MAKTFAIRFAAVLMLSLPATVSASSVVLFQHHPGDTAGFKPVSPTASGDGNGGYWDNKSYDSWTQSVGSACNAAAIASGGACDWKGLPEPRSGEPYQNLTSPRTSTPDGLTYYGMTSSAVMPDTPLDFFFTGPFSFDFEVLFQLSAWDSTVEFGTYEAGNPNNRTPMLPRAGGAAGPYSNNRGAIETSGSASPTGDFGFYYRNTRYGSTPDTEIAFFTESRFNRIGHYFGYFSDPQSGLWQQTPTRFGGDDEQGEARFVGYRQRHQPSAVRAVLRGRPLLARPRGPDGRHHVGVLLGSRPAALLGLRPQRPDHQLHPARCRRLRQCRSPRHWCFSAVVRSVPPCCVAVGSGAVDRSARRHLLGGRAAQSARPLLRLQVSVPPDVRLQ